VSLIPPDLYSVARSLDPGALDSDRQQEYEIQLLQNEICTSAIFVKKKWLKWGT